MEAGFDRGAVAADFARGAFARGAVARVEGDAFLPAALAFAVVAFACAGEAFAATGAASGAGPEPPARLLLRLPGRDRGRFPSTPDPSLLSAVTDEK